ncbi:ABC transporter permease [Brucella tritici]|uniref:ABC transporter permease n=1 Tax=Brucella tritici TaxID=94626 RepID=A0A833CG85_9HYPH|nr:ABC transporter permease [Brucella tritici]KAB2661319.1 ABC transporter permease [Brucella tritici]
MTSQTLKGSGSAQEDITTDRSIIGTGAAIRDIRDALATYRIALIFGWQDVSQRYRRSRLGAFWLTINMAVYIGALGMIFGTLFRSNMPEYLPHLCAGIIVWGLISSSLVDGCTTFSGASGIILQVKLPLFTHILRALWKNMIIFFHNILIFPILYLVLGQSFNFYVLLAIPGLLIVCLNLAWIMLVLATICCRFRDITQIVTNILQIFFYLTPIIWTVNILPKTASKLIFEMNPFYHLLQLIRAPLFGEPPTLVSWLFAIGIAITGWLCALVFFGKYRWRIPYWL